MKKIFLAILLLPLVISCKSAMISTHQQVMNNYDSKSKVINRFGLPDTKLSEGDIEQWYYDFGTRSSTSIYNPTATANTTVKINDYDNTITANTTYNRPAGRKTTNTYSRYIKFIINPSTGNVESWNSNGVNLELIDKKQRLKNILYPTLAVVGVGILWAILDNAAFERELAQEDYDRRND